ncbi:MAG: pyruvate formate lyase family protein [Eubacteriales bacterium]|nr:pyruvate formate lyase family protein [Eubacteriales bacterium]
MAEKHTDARGCEPFDKFYSLGYQTGHDEWSPYPRVDRLRHEFFKRPYNISTERMKLVTEAYKAHPTAPKKLQVAYAFKNVLENCALYMYPDELIPGEIACAAKEAPIYPEFSVAWILNEVDTFEKREHDQFYWKNEQDKKDAMEYCSWWQGKTVADRVEGRLDDEQLKGSEAGAKVFQCNLYHYAGVGHLAIDYAHLMAVGFDGIIADAKKHLEELTKKDPEYADKRDWYQAAIISDEAAKTYIERYAHMLEQMAAQEKNETRKKELEQMAQNCHNVAGPAPHSFWEAITLFHFATTMICIEGNGHSISYGRMDQWLYPYYLNSLKDGVSKEFMEELIEDEYVKLNSPTKLKDWGSTAVRNGRGFGGESLTIGGVDTEGNDATNDLTMMMLEASAHTRMMNPWVAVRMHNDSPYELKVKVVQCIRAGYGHPKLYNDGPAIKLMQSKGMTLEEARDYCVVGCVEPSLPGKEYGWHDAAYINTPKMLELALNHGRFFDEEPGIHKYITNGVECDHMGPDNGGLDTFKSMDEVKESITKQYDYWADQIQSCECIEEEAHEALKPLPYVSSVGFQHCMLTGKDLVEGGAEYNNIGPQASGLGTCADSLATIKQLVFDEKKVTGAELLQAVKDNWVGHEKLYAYVNSSKVHHYGNDDDYADELFEFMFNTYTGCIAGRKNRRGGEFRPGVYSVNSNVPMGMATNASLDGRKKGEAISDNMGPVHTDAGSHDVNGPTAVVNSLSKVDHSKATNGTLMNLKFPEDAVDGVQGRDNMVNFITEYIRKGCMHVQFNVMSSDKMRAAQKHPEDYKDMLVRVAGYSAYFVELGKYLQKDLIQRTELHF